MCAFFLLGTGMAAPGEAFTKGRPATLKIGLRTMLIACLGGVGLAFTAGTATILQVEAGERLHRVIGEQLHLYAGQVADKLDRGMFERYRDLLVVTSLETIRATDSSRDSRRAVLQKLQDSYPDYAWIGFIRPTGLLEAATGRVYEGMDVSARDWWKQGFDRPYVGDVHDAVVLGKLLYANRMEVPRFVDLAAPVRDEQGTLTGVVAAHLSWDWASEVERSVLGQISDDAEVEAMILSADGTVILGPKPLVGKPLAFASAQGRRAWVESWPDGRNFLTSVVRTKGYRDYPGLGWSVVLRQPVDQAMAPVAELRNRVIAWGIAASLLAVLVGHVLATWLSAPLRAMSRAVEAAGPDGAMPVLPLTGRYTEAATLSGALHTYVSDLQEADRRLRGTVAEKTVLLREVHHRVKNNLQVIYGLMMVEMRRLPKGDLSRGRIEALAGRVTSMGRLHEQLYTSGDLMNVDFGTHLRQLCDALQELLPNEAVTIHADTDDVACSIELATPLGLIANELVINALKHAFPERRRGTVTVRLRQAGDHLTMTVADDGIGCPDMPPKGGIGTTLVDALVRQVGGTISFEARSGCTATVSVPFTADANRPVAVHA